MDHTARIMELIQKVKQIDSTLRVCQIIEVALSEAHNPVGTFYVTDNMLVTALEKLTGEEA